jgi:hypothetical protein
MVHVSSLIIRITAWYDWLLMVLVLALGAYTCECLDSCLSIGVQNAIAIRAKEVGGMFAATGQIPAGLRHATSTSHESFVSWRLKADSQPDFSDRPETPMVASGDVRGEPKPPGLPTKVVRRRVHDAGFLVATARSTFGNKEYLVEVKTPKKPIKAVFRQTAIRLLLGLVAGLTLATFGSCFFVKRALMPVQKIALAVEALPRRDEGITGAAALEQIQNLCVSMNEMIGRLEHSFEIGVGLPAEAFHAPGNRSGASRGEIAQTFENGGQSIGMPHTLFFLLQEAERLSDISRNLATPPSQSIGQTGAERLRYYLGGLAISRLKRLFNLSKELALELTSEARDPAKKLDAVRW